MQAVPLMPTKNCHQSANYWGGGHCPTNKIIGGHMPPCPPEVYAYVNQHEHRECRFRYQKLIPEIIGTKLSGASEIVCMRVCTVTRSNYIYRRTCWLLFAHSLLYYDNCDFLRLYYSFHGFSITGLQRARVAKWYDYELHGIVDTRDTCAVSR